MAEVVITIRDDDNYKTTTDVQFNPPLNSKPTIAQSVALRFVHLYGNSITGATPDRLTFHVSRPTYQ